MLHSNTLKQFDGELPIDIKSAINEISQYFGNKNLKVLTLDEYNIALPVTYDVSMPSRGAVNNIDIRSAEPMLIKLSLKHYPHYAPFILSDRKDFPKTKLSHLYFTSADEPARLCLVRNNPHEWFAKIKMADFLDAGSQWLYNAATGQLDENGDEFDPTRLEGRVFCDHIYKYDVITEVILRNQRLVESIPVALFAGAQTIESGELRSIQTNVNIPFIAIQEVLKILTEVEKEKESGKDSYNALFTPVFWESDDKIEDLYLTSMPDNYGQLKAFFSLKGISIHDALLKLEKLGVLLRRGLPIIYALKRPKKIVGYNGNYEYLNFHITLPETGVKDLKDDTLISLLNHIEPFSKDMAMHLSGKQESPSTLYIGAGSLGSKIILHDARGGNLDLGVCDHDKLLPHNLSRNELFSEHLGMNKADAITKVIRKFYSADNTKKIIAYQKNAISLKSEFQEYDKIIDTTASSQVLNYMISRELPSSTKYCKAEIADEGALGLIYIEGKDRNPRMDDLTTFTCYLATSRPALHKWRVSDTNRPIKTLNVGLGCSSTTSVMADDVISFHASVFSMILSKPVHTDVDRDKGFLIFNSIDEGSGSLNIASEKIMVDKFDILECELGSGWQIRMMAGIKQRLLESCASYGGNETGGVLIGAANYKTKVIHVFNIISEPLGSHGTCTGFTRGIQGLPEEVEKIKAETGNVIGYIGEWHTHPMDLKMLSARDKETIEDLKVLNRHVPIPTCAVVVTPHEILIHVVE